MPIIIIIVSFCFVCWFHKINILLFKCTFIYNFMLQNYYLFWKRKDNTVRYIVKNYLQDYLSNQVDKHWIWVPIMNTLRKLQKMEKNWRSIIETERNSYMSYGVGIREERLEGQETSNHVIFIKKTKKIKKGRVSVAYIVTFNILTSFRIFAISHLYFHVTLVSKSIAILKFKMLTHWKSKN